MKQTILASFFLISLLSCSSVKNEKRLEGYWYTCRKNGDYIEMYFKDNQYKITSNFTQPSKWNKYQINGDTLIQYDKFLFEDSLLVNKMKFKIEGDELLKLDDLSANESWVFIKIEDQALQVENELILKREVIERAQAAGCIDTRTEDERIKDSLANLIEFQF